MYLDETRDGGCYLSLTGKAELVNSSLPNLNLALPCSQHSPLFTCGFKTHSHANSGCSKLE